MSNPEPRPRRVSRQRDAGEATRKETRRRVLAAAAAEFADRGFSGATVARIADRADVAVPTLYSAWGSKRALLRAVMANAVTGLDNGFDLGLDRNFLLESKPVEPAGPALRRDPARLRDPASFLAHLAHRYRMIAERSAVGWKTYRDGAGANADIATDWQELQQQRRETFRVLLANLPDAALRPDLTRDQAIDTAWAIASPDTHELLILRRSWTYDQYETWVATTLRATLLATPPR